MPKTFDAIYIGIRGTVLALDRATGKEIWRAGLKGMDFVNVVVDGDKIIATTKGEMFCIDAATGQILWNNELRGLGRGLVSVATAGTQSGTVLPLAEKKRRDDAAAAAAAVSATS
jgi:outer membrane protein assembly factor BamB